MNPMKWALDYAAVNQLICKALKLEMESIELSVTSTFPNMEKESNEIWMIPSFYGSLD